MPVWNIHRRVFNFLASVKFAIPLLIAIAVASIAGSLIPQGSNVSLASDTPRWVTGINNFLQLTDIYHSWWYILLLGLLGASLLLITLKRIPALWKQRGLSAGLGVLLAHFGILIILGGMFYGGMTGFRYYTYLVEGDVTVLPPLPFVVKLDKFQFKFYPEETFSHWGPDFRFPRQQDSTITLYHHGKLLSRATVAPGRPVVAKGITLLPSEKDVGWVFNLVVTDPNGRRKVVPIRPWAPPLISLAGGTIKIMSHRLTYDWSAYNGDGANSPPASTEIFRLNDDGTANSLGFATQEEPLKITVFTAAIEAIRPYTGLHVYRRPEKPFFIAGFITLLAGLFWTFFRRGPKNRTDIKQEADNHVT